MTQPIDLSDDDGDGPFGTRVSPPGGWPDSAFDAPEETDAIGELCDRVGRLSELYGMGEPRIARKLGMTTLFVWDGVFTHETYTAEVCDVSVLMADSIEFLAEMHVEHVRREMAVHGEPVKARESPERRDGMHEVCEDA